MNRKQKNYRVFCYINKRRLEDGGRTILSIKTLESYCKVPNYTIQHLVNLRRLITDKYIDDIIEVLENEFGYTENELTSKEESEMDLYELFQ
tara:strand:+ start:797 stop:1072 length:276 start_codon:yes stop_codon:yes gene_type:complete